MTDPTTTNVLLTVPLRGADVGTWDVPVNNNTTAIDGYFGGVVTITLTNAPVTLTAPSGVTTPGAGPFQSQNRILKFTGTLTSNVQVTLPLPGEYTIQNLTVGNFVVTFAAASAGNVISTPQGSVMHVWNDGSNVYLVKNVIPGALTFLGGVAAVPSWISACTIPPYLLCDGSVYNFSVYPALGNLYLGSFGGNGVSTFGVEDLRGRVPLAYDGTGARITVAGCGINGQTLGASGGNQITSLARSDLPNVSVSVSITDPGHFHAMSTESPFTTGSFVIPTGTGTHTTYTNNTGSVLNWTTDVATTGISASFNLNSNVAQTTPSNVPPAQVSGIWLVAT